MKILKYKSTGYRSIYFDDYTENTDPELSKYWSQVCPNHANLVNHEKDEAGSGICGVVGCDKEAAHYVDMDKAEVVKSNKVEVEFLYRDGANYKTYFSIQYDKTDLSIGDEIEMGKYNTLPEEEFFSSDTHEYAYDPKYDHNLLEVVEVRPVEEVPA